MRRVRDNAEEHKGGLVFCALTENYKYIVTVSLWSWSLTTASRSPPTLMAGPGRIAPIVANTKKGLGARRRGGAHRFFGG